jgi:hypothetical protein
MVKMYCYTLTYKTGEKIQHYDIETLCEMANKFNEENFIKHRFNVNKIRRYASCSSIPICYKSFEKIPLCDFLGVKNLALANYRKMFDEMIAG